MEESNFALAILSWFVCLLRITAMQINYVPRYANVLYDILLSGLWCFSLARQYTSTALAGCVYNNIGQLKDMNVCTLDTNAVGMAAWAMVLYSCRMLIDAGSILNGRNLSAVDGKSTLHEYLRSRDVLDECEKAQKGSLSPVLAFFPDTTQWSTLARK